MQVTLIIINVLLILNAIILIISVLMQDGARAGLGAISGGAETFFGKSKAKGYEGKLEMITKVGVAVFIVLAISTTAISARRSSSSPSSGVDLSNPPSVEDLMDLKKSSRGEGLDTSLPEEAAIEGEAEAEAQPAADAEEPAAPQESTPPAIEAEVPEAQATEAPETQPTQAPEAAPVEAAETDADVPAA